MTQTIVAIATALVQGIPKLIEAIKAGRHAGDIMLSDFISTDALETMDRAIARSETAESKYRD